MKLFDKLKNALFEEEYVEVEEKPKEKKKEKPIAKKIVLPESKKETRVEEYETLTVKEEAPKKDFKFPAILEDDFIDLSEEVKNPEVEKPKEVKKEPVKRIEPKEEVNLYQGKNNTVKQEEPKLYGGAKDSVVNASSYGRYERKQEKHEFHPSPIISPIYGILDQNYKKDDIVTKKEVRISSSYSSKKLDVDSVREKAYGNNDDIFEEELKPSEIKFDKENTEEEDSLLDISEDRPTVPKVTVGDAEEYFTDLGLEYNVDYKDASHEKSTGRRSDLKKEGDKAPTTDGLEDNLFDLIDSMYDEKKGE